MIGAPAVTVHELADVHAALAQARPVTLISAEGAARWAGCSWWMAMIRQGRATFPDVPCCDILDCADAAGRAMAALRAGQRRIILAPTSPAFRAVSGAAASIGAVVIAQRPPSLDLADRGARRRLRAWLGSVTGSEA